MAQVWKARGPGPAGPTSLALKVMWRGDDPDFYKRFVDEVRISTRLRHAHIVEVYGGHEVQGWLLQPMELIDGITLEGLMRRCERNQWPIPVPVCLWIARCKARALTYVHLRKNSRGVPMELVHRDVSPHNVMLTRAGGVKLLDFGIAKGRDRLIETRPGIAKGKARYMSPEQVRALDLDGRSDIFSAGVVLWETLTGRRLFDDETDMVVMQKVDAAVVPRVESLRPEVPPEAADLLHRMLAQKPTDRVESMAKVERELMRVLACSFEPEEFGPGPVARWLASVLAPPKNHATTALPPL